MVSGVYSIIKMGLHREAHIQKQILILAKFICKEHEWTKAGGTLQPDGKNSPALSGLLETLLTLQG